MAAFSVVLAAMTLPSGALPPADMQAFGPAMPDIELAAARGGAERKSNNPPPTWLDLTQGRPGALLGDLVDNWRFDVVNELARDIRFGR